MFFNDFFDFDGMHRDDFGGPFSRPVVTVDNRRLYNVLGVDSNADESQIRKAYRLLAKQNHPDKGGDSAKVNPLRESDCSFRRLTPPMKCCQIPRNDNCMINMAKKLSYRAEMKLKRTNRTENKRRMFGRRLFAPLKISIKANGSI